MIISASYRTDIPAFYADWFNRRLVAGYTQVANPYGGKPYRVSLRPDDTTGFIFWTRNIRPFLANLDIIRRQETPFVVQFTVTAYPRPLESSTVSADVATSQIIALANEFGPRSVVWRYDPVLLTSLTPPEFHLATFASLAARLRGHVDEVCLSFAHVYRKTARNLDRAAKRHDFTWHDPPAAEKHALLAELSAIAADRGMMATICSQPDVDLPAARCIDVSRLSDVAGRQLPARQKGNRPGCLCAESRDIGAYDTCPHGCCYCYAVSDRNRAVFGHRRHDPAADMLAPRRQPDCQT